MRSLPALFRNSVISGTIASAVSAAVLAFLAKAEGVAAVQPINATGHWLHSESAGTLKASMPNIRALDW